MNTITVTTKVSENRARAIAGLVFVITLASLLLSSPWPFLFLLADFALRAFIRPRWSPLAAVSTSVIAPLLRLSEEPLISAAPKRFAAAMGFIISTLGFSFGAGGLTNGLLVCGISLGLFSFLESAFGFCVGCKIYALMIRAGLIPVEYCPECVV